MLALPLLLLVLVVQKGTCKQYSNTTTPRRTTTRNASTEVGTASTKLHATHSNATRTATDDSSIRCEAKPSNPLITPAPAGHCGASFSFSSAGQASLCLNCPQSDGVWAQPIPNNNCSACCIYPPEIDWQWVFAEDCEVSVGTVSLTYWPTGTSNVTYASTYYDPTLDFTYTSPSVYFRVNTIAASNACGPLGPTVSNGIFAFDLDQVSTLIPGSVASGSTRRQRSLDLSDLELNCPSTKPTKEEAFAYKKNEVNRCNPHLVWPMDIKRFGYPYWKHCGALNNRLGIYDPPHALTQVATAAGITLPNAKPTTSASASSGPSITAVVAKETGTTQATAEASSPARASPAPQQSSTAAAVKNVQADSESAGRDVEDPAATGIADWIAQAISAVKASSSSATAPVTAAQRTVSAPDPKSGDIDASSIPSVQVADPINDPGSASESSALDLAAAAGSSQQAATGGTVISIGAAAFTVVSSGDSILLKGASTTAILDPGDPVPVQGQAVSLVSDGLVLGTSTLQFAAADPAAENPGIALATLSANGQTFTAASKDGSIVLQDASSTIHVAAGQVVTFAGETVTAGNGGVVLGSSTVSLAAAATPQEVVLTASNGEFYTASAEDDGMVIKGPSLTTTIQHGEVAAFDGQTLSAVSGALVVGSSTVPLQAAATTAAPSALLTGSSGQIYAALSSNGNIILQDAYSTISLNAGDTATFAGQTITAASNSLLIGPSTVYIAEATTTGSPAQAHITGSSGQVLTAVFFSKNGEIILQGPSSTTTLHAGETAAFEGGTLCLESGHLMQGTATVSFTPASTSNAAVVTGTDDQPFIIQTASPGAVVLENASQTITLSKGQAKTIDGEVISVLADGTGMVVNGTSTIPLSKTTASDAETTTATGTGAAGGSEASSKNSASHYASGVGVLLMNVFIFIVMA